EFLVENDIGPHHTPPDVYGLDCMVPGLWLARDRSEPSPIAGRSVHSTFFRLSEAAGLSKTVTSYG
ncbi:MAG: hypothetical protein ACREVT_09145, partial [Burkholderiales bacterium]